MAVSLVPATEAHLLSMMPWFPDEASVRLWAGDAFRVPFTPATFVDDARLADLPSRALLDADGVLVAFGQYYLRQGRCHVGRLAVTPEGRGRGFGKALVAALVREGAAVLDVDECSLFVLPTNTRAAGLYRTLGFRPMPYPGDELGLDVFDYMVAAVEVIAPSPDGAGSTGS